MLEELHGVPKRIADLKRKLAAREGKKEFKENCAAIRAEIARLEALTIKPAVASEDKAGVSETDKDVTL